MDEEALTELLECSVCLEQLDHTSKVLPCQHTFCRRCLEEILGSKHELKCPECRFLVEIPVEDLPSNILLIRLLEGIKTQVRSQAGGRRSRGADQAAGLRADNSVGAAAFARQQQQRQVPTTNRPCAEALFNYDGKDPGDLSFKKGDTVYLRKQVDENWYHGEMNGQHGFFPATYVKVKIPLPATLPQCVGLYDFEVDESKERDCLPFKKEETVTVIRQVDDNWLEGKKGDKIGIFPISFVKLNEPARKLLSLFGTNGSNGIQEFPDQGPPATPAHPVRTSNEGSPAGEIVPQTKPQNKRHSLTSITGSPTMPSSVHQRRSLEITSDTDFLGAGALIPIGPSSQPVSAPVNSSGQISEEAAAPGSPSIVRPLDSTVKSSDTNTPQSNDTRPKESEPGVIAPEPESSVPPQTNVNTPQIYVAVYNYKPQKTDELELRKGEYYTVYEKCQDGWFKGKCLKMGIAGVFPGNYVQLYSTHSSAFKAVGKNNSTKVKGMPDSGSGHGHSHMPSAASAPSLSGGIPVPPRPKTSPGRASSVDRENIPPPLVPRSAKLTSPQHNLNSASSSRNSPNTTASGPRQNSPQLGATNAKAASSKLPKPASPRDVKGNKPDGSSHSGNERSIHSGDRTSPAALGASSGSSVSPVWKHSMSVCANITPPNVALGTKGSTPPGLSGSEAGAASHMPGAKEKDKKDKKDIKDRLIQMKRLATGKGKKSKHSPSSEMDRETLVTHNRSGSYPSDGSSSDSGQHKKTGSFDSTSNLPAKPSRPKPLIRERYRCIETYPPQSEMELELKIGDIIYVHKKRDDGWFKGTLQRSGKTGLFPGSFVEKCD